MEGSTILWPNTPFWYAGTDGIIVDLDGRDVHLSIVDCGLLQVPSGRLAVCDPFTALEETGNPYVDVPTGAHRVLLTLADQSGKGDGSKLSSAYATLVLGDGREVKRATLTPSTRGTQGRDFAPERFTGFPVDAGTACFVDLACIERCITDHDAWQASRIDPSDKSSWINQLFDPNNIREGIANIRFPEATADENIILFQSGAGDGFYPIVGGFDKNDELVRLHVDFDVL